MAQLVAQASAAPASLGARTLLTGSTYGVRIPSDGRLKPSRTSPGSYQDSGRIQLLPSQSDLSSSTSGLSRVLLTGSTYAVHHTAGMIRTTRYGILNLIGFGTWDIDIASAIAWPLIAFQSHTHNVTDWTIDATSAIEWEPLAAGGAWDWPIDIQSSITWAPLTVRADWNIDIRASLAWELSTGARITDPGDGSAWRIDIDSVIEWESIYGQGINDWTIDMRSSLQWVTYTEVKDLLCVVSNEDAVSEVPAAPIENSVY